MANKIVNGTRVEMSPSESVSFDAGRDVSIEAQLNDWRASSALTKTQFIMACVAAGILTSAEAVAVGRGDWPSAMSGFLIYLSEEQAIEVQIEWAAQMNIRRTNVFVLLLGSWLQYSDAQLDALFGWSSVAGV
jgi:hypothetical protein